MKFIAMIIKMPARLFALAIILTILSNIANAQNAGEGSWKVIVRQDTINIRPFTADIMVSYQLDSITIIVDLEDFKIEFDRLWQTYKRYRQGKQWRFLDSIHNIIPRSLHKGDTLFLSRKSFRSANLDDLGNFFPYMIEKNRCAILDRFGKVQQVIVRQYGSSSARGEGYGGKRYFIIGSNTFFIEFVTWET